MSRSRNRSISIGSRTSFTGMADQTSSNVDHEEKLLEVSTQAKTRKKGLTQRFKSIFRKNAASVELPAQQITSQTTHWRNTPYEPPEAPKAEVLDRHIRRITSQESLPNVHSYQNLNQQVFRVAYGSRSSLDQPETSRQPSSETKDTWERGTVQSGTGSSRVSSNKRLTVLEEDVESQPSSSAGRVGNQIRFQSIEQVLQTPTNRDRYTGLSGLAQAIRERDSKESEFGFAEDQSSGFPTVIRTNQRNDSHGFYPPSFRHPSNTQPQPSLPTLSSENIHNPWSNVCTIRQVSASTNESINSYTNHGDSQNDPQQSQCEESTEKDISPTTESVYSRDEEGNSIVQDVSTSNVVPACDKKSIVANQSTKYRPPLSQHPLRHAMSASDDDFGPTGSIVDYYAAETPKSVARSGLSPGNLNLAYPRSTNHQANSGFHGQHNENVQFIPGNQSIRGFLAAQRATKDTRKEPSLRQLQREIRWEDQVNKMRQQSQSSSTENVKTEKTNKDTGLYSLLKSKKVRQEQNLSEIGSMRHPNYPSILSNPSRILATRDSNSPGYFDPCIPRQTIVDLDETPRPQRDQLRESAIHHDRGMDRRASGISNTDAQSGGQIQSFSDPFVAQVEQNVWKTQQSTPSKLKASIRDSIRKRKTSFSSRKVASKDSLAASTRMPFTSDDSSDDNDEAVNVEDELYTAKSRGSKSATKYATSEEKVAHDQTEGGGKRYRSSSSGTAFI